MGFWKAFHTPGTCSIAIPASKIAAERWQFSRGPLQWTPWVRRIAPEALCQEFQCGPVGISPFSKDQTPTSVVECGKKPLKRDLYCQDCPVWQHVGDKWEKELRLGWVIYGVETGRSPKNVSFTPWFFTWNPKMAISNGWSRESDQCSSDCRCLLVVACLFRSHKLFQCMAASCRLS